jgi:hypothetical protein
MPADLDQRTDRQQDIAVAGTFPASDPPAGTADNGARAVPPQDLMKTQAPEMPDAVTLRRTFPSAEAAKLALEGLVRDAPLDRTLAEFGESQGGVELRISAPPADAPRLRALLAKA